MPSLLARTFLECPREKVRHAGGTGRGGCYRQTGERGQGGIERLAAQSLAAAGVKDQVVINSMPRTDILISTLQIPTQHGSLDAARGMLFMTLSSTLSL